MREGAAEEVELLSRIARGDEGALTRLYERTSGRVFGLIVRILDDSRDAEEVLQEVYLQVWRLASRYEARRGSLYGWLLSLARSRSIDKTRSKNFHLHRQTLEIRELLDSSRQAPPSPQLEAVLRGERADALQRALARISPRQRAVMELAYFGGYTQAEIAEQLEIPLGTVKSRMRHGLAILREVAAEELPT